MHTQRLCVGVLGLALALAGCGDDDAGGSGDDDLRARYIDAIAATDQEQSSPLTGEESRCFAEVTVDAIGVADLAEALTPEEIEESGAFDPISAGVEVTDDEASKFYDGLSGCIDVRQVFLDSIAAADEMAPGQLYCIDRAVDDALLQEFIVFTLMNGDDGTVDPDLMAELQGALLPCLEAASG